MEEMFTEWLEDPEDSNRLVKNIIVTPRTSIFLSIHQEDTGCHWFGLIGHRTEIGTAYYLEVIKSDKNELIKELYHRISILCGNISELAKALSSEEDKSKLSVAQDVIANIFWMARRYAHNRMSYAVSAYNDAIGDALKAGLINEACLNQSVKTVDGSIWAKDAMLGWDIHPKRYGFHDESKAEAFVHPNERTDYERIAWALSMASRRMQGIDSAVFMTVVSVHGEEPAWYLYHINGKEKLNPAKLFPSITDFCRSIIDDAMNKQEGERDIKCED